jgi:predicted DNA binding CopG/RHH family protein
MTQTIAGAYKKRRVNISLSPYWHQAGKNAAAQAGLSFSAYLEQLIYADSLHNESAE